MKRIVEINIFNFKAYFYPTTIKLDKGENLLIYGENGSGKSSLYKSLDFFFEQSIGREKTKFQANVHTGSKDGFVKLLFKDVDVLNSSQEESAAYSSTAMIESTFAPFVKSTARTKGFLDYTNLLNVYFNKKSGDNLFDLFLDLLSDYVNKSYKFTMSYLTSPLLSDVRESERLVLLVVNKSVFQNMYSFIKLNDSNMQFASFSCLETAVNSMRLYNVLATNPDYMHEYITGGNFSLEVCENEISEKQKEYNKGEEEFSLREFATGLGKFNSFELKNAAVASQLVDGNIFLGLSCGNELGEDLQDEVRKSMIGAYLSLSKHNKMFFNGGIDDTLEELEDKLYAKFLEYIKKFS